MKTETNPEFRSQHAAKEALANYIACGRKISVIKSIKNIDRHDVWQAIFYPEPPAYRQLQIKELYDRGMECKTDNEEVYKANITIFVILFLRIVEFKLPLSVKDAIKVVVDCLGEEVLPKLKEEADIQFKRRLQIVSAHNRPDDEWAQWAKTVCKEIENYG